MKNPSKKTYDELPLLPNIIAETVCATPYTAYEVSYHRSGSEIERIEKVRQAMTLEQIREFADLCDAKCRGAYNANADWFVNLTHGRSGGDQGRDQLYMWITHWLTAYLFNQDGFRRSCMSFEEYEKSEVKKRIEGVRLPKFRLGR